MLHAAFTDFELQFKSPARTSRGVLQSKKGYLLNVCRVKGQTACGVGECSPFEDLSYDDRPGYRDALKELCADINLPFDELQLKYLEWPSILFGLETALLDLNNGGKGVLFKSDFTSGFCPIPINGLIWMGNQSHMLSQINEKLSQGYRVIKIKVGAIDFDAEVGLLKHIRKHHPSEEIIIRLDANGAFTPEDAIKKLEILSSYGIHSIEQPIKAGNHEKMKQLCKDSPIPIALDEELIGVHDHDKRLELISFIKPQYIILKPSLLGGFAACNDWISICRQLKTGYWITSALESNIGLNAIAQYTATLDTKGLPQGLGTGALYTSNFESKLSIKGGALWYMNE